jgi:hypothetical protein
MATPEKTQGPGVPGDVLATLLVALAAIVVTSWPLVSTRPPPGEPTSASGAGLQDIRGRLWQDPFSLVDRQVRPAAGTFASSPRNIPDRLEQLVVSLGKECNVTTDIVAVMVFGGDYPEDIEYRRRTRYAVVSGLSLLNQTPISETGIGYFPLDAALKGVPSQPPTYVPFEFFRHPRDPHQVLLLWLDENAWPETTPLASLAQIQTQLRAGCKPARQGRDILIGPAGARMLRLVAREMSRPVQKQIAIFSTATVAAEALGENTFPSIPRAVLTDSQIMDSVIKELQRRGADVLHDHDISSRIVLVSEWDTLYGRSLPRTFERAVCKISHRCRDDNRAPWLLKFSYLRSLDGASIGVPAAAAKLDKDKGRTTDSVPSAPIERAEGDGQFDYLRRLATQIHTLATIDLDGAPAGPVTAVGVLGSDVYDKSLVLRALRNEFPNATFFTTDLDARLLHAIEYPWTRNLIVGSSFGLALHPDLQRDIPPFRDSYQTATFLATQTAFFPGWARLGADEVRKHLADKILPRVFEIGRNVAVDLSDDVPPSARRRCPDLESCSNIHPEPPSLLPRPSPAATLRLVGLVLLGFGLLYLSSSRLQDGIHALTQWWRHRASAGTRRSIIAGAFAGLLLTFLAIAAVVRDGQAGEPFRWLLGVSMWPTEVLRYLAAVLSIAFLIAVRVTIDRVRETLRAEFGPDIPSVKAAPWPGFGRWLLGAIAFVGRRAASPGASSDAWMLWKRYVDQSTFWSQSQRIVPAAMLFYAFRGLLISFDRPHAPYRGNAAHAIDAVLLLVFCVPLFIWLIFSVSDTIRLGGRYALLLGSDESTIWRDEIIAHAGRRLGLMLTSDNDRKTIERRVISRWLDIRIISTWTRIVSPLIYLPFIVLSILIIARNPLFDNWETPPVLLVVFGISALYAVACALVLRRIAERARSTAIGHLSDLLIQTKGRSDLSALSTQIELISRDISSLREGAFARFTDQPVVRAMMLPLGSSSGLALIHYFGSGG